MSTETTVYYRSIYFDLSKLSKKHIIVLNVITKQCSVSTGPSGRSKVDSLSPQMTRAGTDMQVNGCIALVES